MTVNLVAFNDAAAEGKSTLESVSKAGVVTTSDTQPLRNLSTACRTLASQILADAGRTAVTSGEVDDEATLRDSTIPKLTKRGWLLTDYWQKNAAAFAIEPQQVADAVTESNGLFALVSVLEELVARPGRKTAGDGTGGLPTPGTPVWAVPLLADVAAIKAKLGA